MNPKNFITVTEARKRIFDLLGDVQTPGEQYVITEKGKPKAVLLSFDEYDSLMETLEVMQEFPDLKKDIQEAEREYKSGEYLNYTTLEELLSREGYVFADKGKKTYDIQGKVQTKRGKRTGKNK